MYVDLQDTGISSLPISLTMELLSIWDETFKKLSSNDFKLEALYRAGEFSLVSLMMQQITPASQEQCLKDLTKIPIFQKAYNFIHDDGAPEQLFLTTFRTTLRTTQDRLLRVGIDTLPITFLGSFFERFGLFGESEKKNPDRKATGSFYTPATIAHFIVNKVLEIGNFPVSNESVTCLDPSCGGGIFLVTLAATLFRHKMEGLAKSSNAKVECIRKILTRQVWGMDLSPDAQRVSQLQLILWAYSHLPDLSFGEICSWVVHCSQGDFLANTQQFRHKFSVIVGNPPFGNLLSREQKQAAKEWATTRTREISELFLERALGILDKKGCLGFVMPKTMAYYAQWDRARALLLPGKFAGIADLGLSFPGVNFETLALFAQNLPIDERKDPFPVFAESRGTIGTFPRQYINETGLIPLQPLNPDDEELLNIIRKNSVPLMRLVRSNDVTRGIYMPEETKASCKAGSLLWINRVPDIQHYAIKRLWRVDPGAISLANPSRIKVLRCPKVLVKVLRGRKLSVMADPWGILVPTEKLVSIILDKTPPREILAWNACLNSWPASYYLQKVIFSGTTESARVLDYPYLQHVPVLVQTPQSINTLSGINLILLLAAQVHVQFPLLLPPESVHNLGMLFQQILFLTYSGETPNEPLLAMESEFNTNLQLLHDLFVMGATNPPPGGLSRENLAEIPRERGSSDKLPHQLLPRAQNFTQQVKMLLLGSVVAQLKERVATNPLWNKLVSYFNATF